MSAASERSQSKALTLDEKKALGIVATGNFLEYFDLMLFSHLAFIVTPYFMPKTDPLVTKFLAIFAFSSSFVIRPFAAIFWGYVGDNFGRVVVLSYTTLIMGVSCLIVPSIPPYAELGIYSTFLIIFCRFLQGFSSAGEAKGAEIFVAEIVPHYPKIFLASAFIPITCDLGGLFATLLGSLCISISADGWKTCFYIGAAIAFCSSISRKKLRETKDFLNAQKHKSIKPTPLQRLFERRNFFSLVGLNMICPTAFFFAYSFSSDLLKETGLSDNLILINNSWLLFLDVIFLYICAKLAYRFNPFHILKVRTALSFILMPIAFVFLYFYQNHLVIFLTQLTVLLLTASFDPATPVVIRSFGARTRFSQYSKAWACAKALMYLSTGYLTYYFHLWFGVWGVLGLLLFFSGIFAVSLYFFVPHDKMADTYLKLREKKHLKKNLNTRASHEKPYGREHLKKWIEQ